MKPLQDRILFEALTFDDVLLVPARSEVLPREVSLQARFSRHISMDIPFVSAAMDTVTEAPMAIAMAAEGGLGVIHKNMGIEAQAAQVAKVREAGAVPVAGLGITEDILDRASALSEAGARAVVLDSAHGHSKGVMDALGKLKAAFPGLDVVVGNIATAEAAKDLISCGADALKVGIGPGSICTTRIVAGVGVPQLSAIASVAEAAQGSGVPIIADGGIRYSGDIVKALAAGGDCVMCGSLFAGTDEAPGEVFEADGKRWKTYRGMGSIDAMNAGSADRYFQKNARKLVPEGVVGRIPAKGPVAEVIFQLAGGLRAGMGYVGAACIQNLRDASFVRITPGGVTENHPHDITIAKQAPNYHR